MHLQLSPADSISHWSNKNHFYTLKIIGIASSTIWWKTELSSGCEELVDKVAVITELSNNHSTSFTAGIINRLSFSACRKARWKILMNTVASKGWSEHRISLAERGLLCSHWTHLFLDVHSYPPLPVQGLGWDRTFFVIGNITVQNKGENSPTEQITI